MQIRFRADSEPDARFRADVRRWLARELPDEWRGFATRPPFETVMAWHKKLYAGGYVAPHWPKKYGGAELPFTQQVILKEELARAGAPEISGQGLNHIGPLLMKFGTEEQKARHLPPIPRGDIIWCQGYSEPNSGSDLTSLRTRAVRDGDHFVVTGQKIWTTWAHNAQWMFALVRTEPEAKPQAGISFILVDLATSGITRRGIKTIAGDDELAEVFLDEVRVPVTNLIGQINDGWRVANALLEHERLGSGSPQMCFDTLERVKRIARTTGADADPAFRDRLAQAEIDMLAYAAIYSHAVELVAAGKGLGFDASLLKIAGSETLQRTADLLMEAAGAYGAEEGWVDTGDGRLQISGLFRQVRRASIYGGSNEIQRNILARRVLDLPSWR
jgi:alkylation response protein AidB-like acyl-CoA dehydrogenase